MMRRVELVEYDGFNSYTANDVVPQNKWVYATDGRSSTRGRYITRQGADFYTVPLGETLSVQQTAITGAGNQTISPSIWFATKFTATSTGRLTKIDVNLKSVSSGTGEVIVELWSDSGTQPLTMLGQSCVPASSLTSSYQYLSARFIEAPQVTNTTVYWVVVYVQDNGTNSYNWSSTTNASKASSSTNSGATWSTQAFDMNYKTYVSTDSPTLGLYRAVKSDGTKTSLIAHGTQLYTINDNTGATTSIKSGLSANATDYYFAKANDVVYYVNGQDVPRKWDFTTEAVNPGSPAVARNIINFKNQMFYMDATDTSKLFWSDLGSFESFTSTNFLYAPSTKSDDPLSAWEILNDNLILFTKGTKYVLQGSDISNFTLRRSTGLKGTPSQNSICATRNYIFFLADDGIYRFNGSSDELISQEVTDIIRTFADPTKVHLQISKNRLYVFYPPTGASVNTDCLVYNLDYQTWESHDLNTPVRRSMVLRQDSNQFVLGSSYVGAAYYSELTTNNYSQLGKKLTFEVRTRHEFFSEPEAQKDIRGWYPRFNSQTGNYNVQCQYAKDFSASPTSQNLSMGSSGSTWGGGGTWGSGLIWGSGGIVSSELEVDGLANYYQFRYKRQGVNTPTEFLGHSFLYEVKRPS